MPFINDRLREAAQDQQSCAASHAQPREAPTPTPEEFARTAVGRVDAHRIATQLRATIVHQDAAIDSVVDTLTVVQAGLADPHRPLVCQLLVGPTGTGKTELVRQVAAAVRQGPDDFCRVDMSSLAQEHYAASFAGAPPGYAGSKENLTVLNRSQVEGDYTMPGIVCFDEVEKAHPTVLRALLHVLDRGTMTLANGQQTFSFRNCLIFMTSNLGSREIRRAQSRWWRSVPLADRLTGGPGIERITTRALESFFDPEFLNRVDTVTCFDALTREAARAITLREMTGLVGRARTRGLEVEFGDDVVDLVVEQGFDEAYGARSVRREIRRQVWPLLAEQVVRARAGTADGGTPRVRLVVSGSRLVAELLDVRPG